jgi:BTB/POZ domain
MQINGLEMKRGRDDVIEINVGGTIFKTLVSTLIKHDSMLKRCFENEHHHLSCDSDGISFLDLDPTIFVYILNYMRLGQFFLTPVHPHFDQVGYMANYLGLDDLLVDMQWKELKRDGVIGIRLSETIWKVFVYNKVEKQYACHTLSITHHRLYHEVSFDDETTNKRLLTCKQVEKVTEDFIQNKIKELVFFYASTLFSSKVNDLTLVKLLMSISRSTKPDSLNNQL